MSKRKRNFVNYHRLSFNEREEISRCLARGETIRSISRILRRNASTISREVNRAARLGNEYYRAIWANFRAKRNRKKQGRKRKLDVNKKLQRYVFKKLFLRWSPEQIAIYLAIEYPLDISMRVAKETIYRYIYVQPKGELKRSLIQALRRSHKRRYRKNWTNEVHKDNNKSIPNLISIDERPKEVEDRIVPGHWEGDLLIGKSKRSALGSLVERTTRKTILVPLLNGRDHESVAKEFSKEFVKIPSKMRKTMTYDQGSEMSSHEKITQKTKIIVYFSHGGSPWERGTNENTNGLVRQFFPKGTDFTKVSRKEIKRVEKLLNGRPRKVLDWKKPEEMFDELLR